MKYASTPSRSSWEAYAPPQLSTSRVPRTTHSSVTLGKSIPLHGIANNVFVALSSNVTYPLSFLHLVNTSNGSWTVRQLTSSFEFFSGQSRWMTQWRQVLTNIWDFRITMVITFQVLLLYNSTEKTLARKSLNLMFMLEYLDFQIWDKTVNALLIRQH